MGGLIESAAKVALCAANVPYAVLNGSILLISLILIGSALIMARHLVIVYAPWIGAHAQAAADVLSYELNYIEGFIDIIKVGVELVVAVISILSGRKPHIPKPTWNPQAVSAAEVMALTHELSYRCRSYDNLNKILVETSRTFASPFVCPLLRETYPLKWAYAGATATAGWLSYDSAPPPYGGNCEAGADTTDLACVAFGVGYVVLEVLAPLYFALMIGSTGLWTALLVLLYNAAKTLVGIPLKLIAQIVKSV